VVGYRTWTEAEIEQYRNHWPSGTKQRLAFELLLCTGQRRSDVVRMGRQHMTVRQTIDQGQQIRATYLSIRQQKTGNAVVLPILPELAAELEYVHAGQLTFLARENGTAHTAGGFYNLFVSWCADAGLPPGLAPHGLRKALGRRLAEYGATANEIAAMLGHSGLSEVETYTRAAEQARLAAAAGGRITNINWQPGATKVANLTKTLNKTKL
jgi:integrase